LSNVVPGCRLDSILDMDDAHSQATMALKAPSTSHGVVLERSAWEAPKIPKKLPLPKKPDYAALALAAKKQEQEAQYSDRNLMELYKLDQKSCRIGEGLASIEAGIFPPTLSLPKIRYNYDEVVYGRDDKFSRQVEEVKAIGSQVLELARDGMLDNLSAYYKVIQEAANNNYQMELAKFPDKDHELINSLVEKHREKWGLNGNNTAQDESRFQRNSAERDGVTGKRAWRDNSESSSPKPNTARNGGPRGGPQQKKQHYGFQKRGGHR
jgi:hypothetical protein